MFEADDLIAWIGGVHARTYEAVELLGDAHLAWRPRAGELSAGEVVLHIANSRLMNLQTLKGERQRYKGHSLKPGTTAPDLRQAILRSSKKTIAGLVGPDFDTEVRGVSGDPVSAWRIVLAGLIEHEVHHRSALCDYLGAMGIAPPPLFGLHAESLPA
jgi:uncharacterized damage-inducible protein DinB